MNLLTRSVFLALCISGFNTSRAQINYPFQDLRFNTNSTVTAIAVDETNNVTYIGGFFTRVNTAAHGTVLDAATALNPRDFPQPNGSVFVAISDGSGGYYIGGTFTRVGGIDRQNIAHINSAGEVTSWNPSADAVVRSMALSGNILYVGGDFANIGGQARQYLAALDANGNATGWAPTTNSSFINAIEVDGSIIYIAGGFSTVNNSIQSRIAALDTNGDLIDWNPNIGGGSINDMTIDKDIVYIAGSFSLAGGEARSNLAAIDDAGAATSWDPSPNGTVRSICLDNNILYIGGDFTSITTETGSTARNYLAALDLSGEVTSWNPSAVSSISAGAVNTLSVANGIVYAGGNFTLVNGQARSRVAAIDVSGVVQDWNPSAGGTVLTVFAGNEEVYVGGSFPSIGGVSRNRLASFDATGAVTDWNPSPNSLVRAIAIGDGLVYVGGEFTSIGGESRNRLSAFDASGNLTDWDPSPNTAVRTLATGENALYAGGDFTTVNGESRGRLAAFSSDGTLTSWNPSADGIVRTLSVDEGLVFAGGDFTTVGSDTRNGIAAIDATGDGSVSSWNPSAAAGSVFNSIAVADGIVYAGGEFSTIGSSSRNNLAAIDAGSGGVTTWDPSPDDAVNALAISNGVAYIAGDFTTISSESRVGIAAVDVAGALESWDLQLTSSSSVSLSSLAVNNGSVLFGGFFYGVGGDPVVNMGSVTVFDDTDPVFISDDAISVIENTTGTIYTAAADETVTFSLGSSKDEGLFSLNAGAISFNTAPDFENPLDGNADNQYLLDITAIDFVGNTAALEVIITVTDADEVVPVITLIGANPQTIELGAAYTELGASANDDVDGDISGSIVIDATAVDVTDLGSYAVTYNVSDASGNDAVEVSRTVNVVDTTEPNFTSTTAVTVDENIATSEIIYTAAATDAGTITYGLSGTDANSFTLVASSGELTFVASPDFETQSSYSVTITATDASGNASDLVLTITINDVDEGVVLGLKDGLNVSVYPNPVTDQISIQGQELSNYNQLTVNTIEGKEVLSFQNLSTSNFNVSGLSPGIYILLLKSDDQVVNAGRIIKK